MDIPQTDEARYDELQGQQAEEWESLCRRCGACCGLEDGDPCEHLIRVDGKDEYACRIYENRFGLHKTKSGNAFYCVPLRIILHIGWPGDYKCVYKKNLTSHE